MSHKKILPAGSCTEFKESVEQTNLVAAPLIIPQNPNGDLGEDSPSNVTTAAAISSKHDNRSARDMAAAVKSMHDSPSAKTMAAIIKSMDNNPSASPIAAALKSIQDSPSAKAVAAIIKSMDVDPSARAMAAAVKSIQDSPSAQAVAAIIKSVDVDLSARAMAGAFKSMQESPSAKAVAAIIKSADVDPTARAMAAAFKTIQDSPSAKAMAAIIKSMEDNHSSRAMAAAIESMQYSHSAKTMAVTSSAWLDNPAFKTAIEAVRSLEVYPTLKEVTGPTLSLVKWGVTEKVTVGEVLEELATRSDSEQRTQNSHENCQLDEHENRPVAKDVPSIGVLKNAIPHNSLNHIPTWALLLWLFVVTPLVFVVVNWESARAGLADLNARLPQTESLTKIRNFIRTELTGKAGDIRLVKGKNVRLREGPGMKEDVTLLLPSAAIVTVLGKEDKTWLYVSYEHHGHMIDGYVSTRFLKKIRR